jgi:hypothetical protein
MNNTEREILLDFVYFRFFGFIGVKRVRVTSSKYVQYVPKYKHITIHISKDSFYI